MRIALLGAFPFPAPQGSQHFAAEQARALAGAGVEPLLLCYGRAVGAAPAGLRILRTPERLSPRRVRAGFAPAKPLADLALAALLRRVAARAPLDAVLAHNAEATAVALAARPGGRFGPLVYVAHTLWAEELGAYLPAWLGRLAPRAGAALDAELARRADAVLALSERAARRLARFARGPVACVPPPLAPAPPTPAADVAAACRRHGLVEGGYALYAGNLDAYQDLPLLARAARGEPGLPIVVATHDPRGPALPGVQVVAVRDPAESRALLHGARVALLPRRRAGGFPLKLLHYWEAGRPVVAFARVADGVRHEETALAIDPALDAVQAGAAIAAAIRRLAGDPALAARLAAGGARQLAAWHAPARCAEATLALVAEARAASR